MTDTQETMRKTGAEIIEEYRNQSFATCQLSLEEMIDREIERCTAQSAEKITRIQQIYGYECNKRDELLLEANEKIARLEARNNNQAETIDSYQAEIARLKAENENLQRINVMLNSDNAGLILREAAAELSNRQLRELRYELMGIAEDVDAGKGFDVVCRKTLQRVMDALAQPISAEALDAYVASKLPAWQPIETAPKDGTIVWAYGIRHMASDLSDDVKVITQAKYTKNSYGNYFTEAVATPRGAEGFTLLAWMPLPPAPEKE